MRFSPAPPALVDNRHTCSQKHRERLEVGPKHLRFTALNTAAMCRRQGCIMMDTFITATGVMPSFRTQKRCHLDAAQLMQVEGTSAHPDKSARVVEAGDDVLAAAHGGGAVNAAGGQAQAAAQGTHDVQYRRAAEFRN